MKKKYGLNLLWKKIKAEVSSYAFIPKVDTLNLFCSKRSSCRTTFKYAITMKKGDHLIFVII